MTNLSALPANLIAPTDDNTARHLEGMHLPVLTLIGTDNISINLGELKDRYVIYIYPMTGRPEIPLPEGWDQIPGARGCTPQSCAFRDHYAELQALNVNVFGLSSQSTEYQLEARNRLHLPFQLLSDQTLQLKDQLRLPTFSVLGMTLYKRLTMIVDDAQIKKVFYPVFPPDRNADDVIAWLRANPLSIK
jgi:peroxiredoxin